jgi:hypothetical protein
MGLGAPLALVALAAVALPIIAHLLRRRDVPVRPLATLALLRRADVASRRRVRVVDPLLLAVRVLLVAVAAVALASPFLLATLAWGDGRLASVAIVIDDSMSMSQRSGSGTALDAAISRASDVVQALPAGSEVAVVLGGEPPRVLVARTDDLGAALGRIRSVPAGGARGTALGPAIARGARQLAGARHPLRRVLVLSDGARHAQPGDTEVPRDVTFELENVGGDEGAPNLAVVEAIASPDPAAGTIEVAIEVRSFGDDRERAPVAIRRGGVEIARGEVVLERRGEAASIERGGRAVLHVPAPDGADPTAEVRIDAGDALPLDDARGLLLRSASSPRVLLVDGDPSPLGMRRLAGGGEEVRFVAQALALAPRAGGGFVHRTVDADTFPGAGLGDVDVVVLANVSYAGAALRSRVEQHVARGGGVLVAAGDHVAPGAWARAEAWLPARIVSVASGETVGLSPVAGADPLLPPGPTGLESVRATRRLVLEPAGGAEVALSWSDGAPALAIGAAAPERGRVAVLGTTLDDEWSDLPYRPGFLPLVVRVLRALAPPGAMPDAPFSPGRAPELRAPLGAYALELVAPSGTVISPARGSLDRPIDLSDCVEPGAWRVRVATGDREMHEATRSAFVIAAPAAESDLSTAPPAAARAEGGTTAARASAIVRRPIAPWLFAVVGILAVAEGALRVRRRGVDRAA